MSTSYRVGMRIYVENYTEVWTDGGRHPILSKAVADHMKKGEMVQDVLLEADLLTIFLEINPHSIKN